MPRRPLLALGLLLACLASPAWAQSEADRLKAIEQRLAADAARAAALAGRSEAAAAEVAALTEESVSLAARMQELEQRLVQGEGLIVELQGGIQTTYTLLAERRGNLETTLGALVRLARTPPEALLAAPAPPLQAARAGLVLSSLVPPMEAEAEALRGELTTLAALEATTAAEQERQRRDLETLDEERTRLEAVLARKRSLAALTEAESLEAAERMERLEGEAETLRDLVATLARRAEEERRLKARQEVEAKAAAEAAAAEAAAAEAAGTEAAEVEAAEAGAAEAEAAGAAQPAAGADATETQQAAVAPATSPAPTAQPAAPAAPARVFPESGALTPPVAGRVLVGYGGRSALGGEVQRGFTVSTRSAAAVVAPWDGKIVYAGPFRRYGLILILEHSGRYHSLLAGLGRIDVTLGQQVVAGEPLGVMGTADPPPELYLELRRDGEPLDPTPWFATTLARR